jgi:hypothetical protein
MLYGYHHALVYNLFYQPVIPKNDAEFVDADNSCRSNTMEVETENGQGTVRRENVTKRAMLCLGGSAVLDSIAF